MRPGVSVIHSIISTRCLAFHTYSAVYVPDGEDNAVREYLRMRDDQKLALLLVLSNYILIFLKSKDYILSYFFFHCLVAN